MCRVYSGLKPKKFETFLAAKGFARYVECCLLLWNADPKNKKYKKEAIKVTYLLHYNNLCCHYSSLCNFTGPVPVQKGV